MEPVPRYALLMRWLWLLPMVLGLAWCAWVGYEGLNGQDSHDYLRVAKAWNAWFSGGERPAAAEHPPAFPVAGALLGRMLGDTLLAMRVLPLLAFVLVGFVVRKQLLRTHGNSEAVNVFLLLMIGAAPFLLRHSLVVMSDLPGIALMVLAWALWTKAWETRKPQWVLMCAVAAVLAVVVRFAAVPMVFALFFLSILGGEVGRSKRLFFWALIAAAPFVAALILVPHTGILDLYHASPLTDWSPLNAFRSEHHSDDGVLRYTLPNAVYVLSVFVHPGFLPLGVFLLPFVRKEDLRPLHARAAAAMVVCYLLFIAGMPFQNDRVLLMAQPFAAVLLFPAFARAWAWLKGRVRHSGLVVALLAVVQLALFARALYPFMRNADVERELAAAVNAQGATQVYTHGMGAALSNYCPTVRVTELWYDRIEHFEPGALIIVQPSNLDAQWRGLPPWENWEKVFAQGVEPVEDRPDGWGLYRVR